MEIYEETSWFRLDNETARHYELFTYYLNLEPKFQSYQAVSKQFSISREYVERIAKRFNWESRARAYQNHFAARADEVKNEAIKEIALSWADWELENLGRTRILTEQILSRCEQMLTLPLEETTEKTMPAVDAGTGKLIKDSQGNLIYQTISITKPVRFNASDAPKYAEAAIILTKFLSEQNRPKPAPIGSALPAPAKPVEEMTIEERTAYIEQLRERQRQLVSGVNIIDVDSDEEN